MSVPDERFFRTFLPDVPSASSGQAEVDHDGPDADRLRAVRGLLDDEISRITHLVHYFDVVPSGREWTIALGLDCGFAGRLVFRVDAVGTCDRTLDLATALGAVDAPLTCEHADHHPSTSSGRLPRQARDGV